MRQCFVLAGATAAIALLAGLDDKKVGENNAARLEKLDGIMEKLKPLHEKLGKPSPGDWLASHRESGQTFRQYLRCNPTMPEGKRTVLYIQPLGDFTGEQRKIVTLTAEFMGLYFHGKLQEALAKK